MNRGNSIMFSRGIQMTNINGKINKKEYQAMYDGDINKMILNNNNKIYYIEANEKDIQKLFNQTPSKQNIETKLKLLMNKPKKKKKKKRTKKIRFKIPYKKKKTHYTVRKRNPSKSKSRKSSIKKKTPSKSKSRKKSPSKKTTIQKILPEKLLKTII